MGSADLVGVELYEAGWVSATDARRRKECFMERGGQSPLMKPMRSFS